MLEHCEHCGTAKSERKEFVVGQHVRLLSGAYRGEIGVVRQVDPPYADVSWNWVTVVLEGPRFNLLLIRTSNDIEPVDETKGAM